VATETLTFPDPPTLTNGNDANQDYGLGLRFSVDEAVPCVGVRWVRTPDSVAATPNLGSWVASVWTVVGETRIAFKNFTPTPATDNFDVLFDDPVMLDPSPTLYVVSIFSRDYVYRASGGIELVSPSGMMQADQGKLAASGDPTTFPASNQASFYFVSPIIDLGGDPEEHDTTGTGALTVAASAVTAAVKPTSGTAALTATAAGTTATGRLTTGTAPLAAGASASLSTARVTAGRAELLAGASAARSSVRVTAGTAGLTFAAAGVQVRGGGGPRLTTVSRPERLTSSARPRAISTTTRG